MISQILYLIQIEPILTNGDPDATGKFLYLRGTQPIDSIQFIVSNTKQQTQLAYQGTPIYYFADNPSEYAPDNYNPIIIESIQVNNNILNPVGQSQITLRINSNYGSDLLNSPFLDLFRENDIIRISYANNAPETVTAQQIFVGVIEVINKHYSLDNGLSITLSLGYLTNVLARSQLVQTESNSFVQGTILTSLFAQQFQLGNLIHTLCSETLINQTTITTQYYGGISGGISETIAAGKATPTQATGTSGSALNANSYVFASTPPTGSKLDCILQILYPYQRVIYVSPEGNLIITPLSLFFDETEDWSLDIFGDPFKIGLLDINISSNTALLQNRAYTCLNQLFAEFNKSSNFGVNGQTNEGVSVATPPEEYFPRAYDMVASGKALQTAFSVQSLNANNLLQNSGLLNTAINLGKGKVTGMHSVMVVDNQNAQVVCYNPNLDPLKFLTALYSSRKLAESLFQDLLVDVSMPTLETYNDDLSRFRILPLNQMVNVPSMLNDNFDGQQQLFCYGFSISWSLNGGSITSLNLCKPYVFTALWADSLQEI